jgi:hypothetical protein
MVPKRRIFQRTQLNMPATISMRGHVIPDAQIENVSSGGMCLIYTHTSEEEASTGKVWLRKEIGSTAIDFESDFRKKWVKPLLIGGNERVMGITFEEVNPEQMNNLRKIIKNKEDDKKKEAEEYWISTT